MRRVWSAQLARIVDALCEAGAEHRGLVNRQNHDGRTALHVVAGRGQLGAVTTLLGRGAAIDLQDNDDNAVIHTALMSPYAGQVADIVAAICATEQAKTDKSFVKQPGFQRCAAHAAALHRAVGCNDIPRVTFVGPFSMQKIAD